MKQRNVALAEFLKASLEWWSETTRHRRQVAVCSIARSRSQELHEAAARAEKGEQAEKRMSSAIAGLLRVEPWEAWHDDFDHTEAIMEWLHRREEEGAA